MTAGSPFWTRSPPSPRPLPSPLACACCFLLSAFASALPPSFSAPPFAGAPPLVGFAAAFFLSSAIDQISGTLGETDFPAVIENLETDARRLAVFRIGECDVGKMDRQFLADDPALFLHRLFLVALHDIDAADQRTILARQDTHDLAVATLVATGEDDDLVAFLDLRGHYNTSGASEMIFMRL